MMNRPYFVPTDVLPTHCKLRTVWEVCVDESYHVTRPASAGEGWIALRTRSGCGVVKTKRQTLMLLPQTLVFLRGEDVVQYHTQTPEWNFLWFEFDCASFSLSAEKIFEIELNKTETLYTDECLQHLLQGSYEEAKYSSAVFAALLSYWIAVTDSEPSSEQRLLGQILSELNTTLNAERSVAELAQQVHLSERTLRNLFYRRVGCSPLQYIRDRRLYVARELLRTTDILVKQISAQVGYGNPFYFSRDFKQKFGISPQDFREKKE